MTTDKLPDFIAKAPVPRAPEKRITAKIALDTNEHAQLLFGKFDEHLAILERELDVEAASIGNEVVLRGIDTSVNQARQIIDVLYDRIRNGDAIATGDVEGTIRSVTTASAQMTLPSMEKKGGKLALSSISTARKTIHARSATQDAYIRALDKEELVFGIGPAGTGKTYLAVAHAASLLERGAVDRIILSRPAVEAGERLGFLPGDMKEKVDPYLRPLYDALYDMIPGDKVERALTSGIIEIAPLAFMRGRTLAHSAIILDEAQNTTTMQMKMFLTRLGEGSRMIITGDTSQIDLPPGQTSGLVQALDILQDVEGVTSVAFTAADVVRHRLVARIVEAYDKSGHEQIAARGRSRS